VGFDPNPLTNDSPVGISFAWKSHNGGDAGSPPPAPVEYADPPKYAPPPVDDPG
jgi:hypothetical protein